MSGPVLAPLTVEEPLRIQLEALVRRHTAPKQSVTRAQIVLLAHQRRNLPEIVRTLGVSICMARKWRRRWLQLQHIPAAEMTAADRLADAPRPGAPAKISPEAYCRIVALACEPPSQYGRPITHWTERELAEEAIRQNIVPSISPRQVGRFLKAGLSSAASQPLLADTRGRPAKRRKD